MLMKHFKMVELQVQKISEHYPFLFQDKIRFDAGKTQEFSVADILRDEKSAEIIKNRVTEKITKDDVILENHLGLENDINCSDINFAEAGTFYPPVVLFSFPGSGNTWVRHLLETATGFYSGSSYVDADIYKGGMLGEMEPVLSGRTIVVKSHLSTQEESKLLFNHAKKCIVIYRNPRDAVISEINREMSGSHTGKLNFTEIAKFQKQGDFVYDYVHDKLNGLPRNYISTYKFTSDKGGGKCETQFQVLYEDIVENASREVGKMLDFIGYKSDRLSCVSENTDGNFKRKKKIEQDFNWIQKMLTDEEKLMLAKRRAMLDEVTGGRLPKNYDFV